MSESFASNRNETNSAKDTRKETPDASTGLVGVGVQDVQVVGSPRKLRTVVQIVHAKTSTILNR